MWKSPLATMYFVFWPFAVSNIENWSWTWARLKTCSTTLSTVFSHHFLFFHHLLFFHLPLLLHQFPLLHNFPTIPYFSTISYFSTSLSFATQFSFSTNFSFSNISSSLTLFCFPTDPLPFSSFYSFVWSRKLVWVPGRPRVWLIVVVHRQLGASSNLRWEGVRIEHCFPGLYLDDGLNCHTASKSGWV